MIKLKKRKKIIYRSFERQVPKATLLVFIDDATSKIVWMHFAQSESTKSLMISTQDYILTCGRPLSIYVDHGSVFKTKNSSSPSFWRPATNHPWRNYNAKRI